MLFLLFWIPHREKGANLLQQCEGCSTGHGGQKQLSAPVSNPTHWHQPPKRSSIRICAVLGSELQPLPPASLHPKQGNALHPPNHHSREQLCSQLPASPKPLAQVNPLLSKITLFGGCFFIFLSRKQKRRWEVKSTQLLFAGSPGAVADELPHRGQL